MSTLIDATEQDRQAETGALLERVRASHRRLRREIWDVQPCEYVPCCVTAEEKRDG